MAKAELAAARGKQWLSGIKARRERHDRFDSRIAGYTPDQKERLERYRASLDKQSRFAFSSEKRREAEAKVAELSRFQAANSEPSSQEVQSVKL